MNLELIFKNSELQSLVALLAIGLAVVCWKEPAKIGRWHYLFFLLLMSALTKGTTGFVFLLVAETICFLGLEDLQSSSSSTKTIQFIINIFISTVCLLSTVILNQTFKGAASVPLYVWIYINFIGFPFGLSRTVRTPMRDSFLVYLFCFAVCFKHFVGAVPTFEWTTVLLVITATSVLVGNARVTAALAVLGLIGMSALHFAFAIPFLAVCVAPAALALSLFPLTLLAWLSFVPVNPDAYIFIYPALMFFAARAVYFQSPQGHPLRWLTPSLVATATFAIIIFLNRNLLGDLYDKNEAGNLIALGALFGGVVIWNVLDRKVKWLGVGLNGWDICGRISARGVRDQTESAPAEPKAPQWKDPVPPEKAQLFLQSQVQLTVWFAVMAFAVSIFYWLAV